MMALWQKLDLCYDDEGDYHNNSVKHMKREENDKVFVFLAGLNKDLDEVRERTPGQKSLPTIREVFS